MLLNHTDICRATQLAALLPRDSTRDPNAVSAEQAPEMATLGGATALRTQDQVGSLEVGKQADIVVFGTGNFDLRPLHNPVANVVYGSTGHSVDTVLIGGDMVLRGGQLTSRTKPGCAIRSRRSTAGCRGRSGSRRCPSGRSSERVQLSGPVPGRAAPTYCTPRSEPASYALDEA